MDLSLFQFRPAERQDALKLFRVTDPRPAMGAVLHDRHVTFLRKFGANLLRIGRIIGKRKPFTGSCFVKRVILGFVFLLIATPALGQSSPNRASQPPYPQLLTSTEINQRLQEASANLAGSAIDSGAGESRIGPDDLLNVSIFEAPEMNCTLRVSTAGDISLQLLGVVHAAGLTPRELETALRGLLRLSYMKDPHVGVFVQELQSHPVSVVGAVKTPGVFQVPGTKTVIEVLSIAGGLAGDAGDTVLIMRGAGYEDARNSADKGPTIQSGTSPAPFARGVLAKNYASQSTTPETHSEIEEINLERLLDSADAAMNVVVRPGDIVKVPRAGIVYVVGEVQKPGGFVLQNNQNISVLQALALAEGPTHTSAIGRARLIRTDPATGKRSETALNLGRILSGKAPDALLQAKDIVFVPNSAVKNVLYKGSVAALQTASGVAIYKW